MDEFKSHCREHCLKITPQRLTIFSCLLKATNHPTAEQVYQYVSVEHSNISYDTVNRTLNTFAQIGIFSVIEGFGNSRRFDPNPSCHHHIHCISCGKVIDFTNEEFDSLVIPDAIKKKYTIISKRVVLTCCCDSCQQKQTTNMQNKE